MLYHTKERFNIIFFCIAFFILNFLIIYHNDRYYLSDFYSVLPISKDKAYESDDIGFYIYGPYSTLLKGDYQISFNGVFKGDCVYDIFSGVQNNEFLIENEIDDGKIYDIHIDEDVTDLEFRIFHKSGKVFLNYINVKRIPKSREIKGLLIVSIIFSTISIKCLKSKCKIIHDIMSLCLAFVASLYLFILGEGILAGKIFSVLSYWWLHISFWLLNSVIIFICYYLIYYFIGNRGTALAINSILFFLLFIINYNFSLIRGESFTLSEFLLTRYAVNVLKDYNINWFPEVTGLYLLVTIIFSLIISIRKKHIRKIHKFMGMISVILIMHFLINSLSATIVNLGGEAVVFLKDEYYKQNGYLIGLIQTLPNTKNKPQNYSKSNLKKIAEKNIYSNESFELKNKPNIIYIQNETLYDMSLMMDMVWSDDPLEELVSYQSEYSGGYMLSPGIGGGTANVEYEVLTGYPSSNTVGTPYINMIKEDTKSLVSILNEYGYYTVSFHYNTKSFYNREHAYSNFGFDKSLWLEDVSLNDEDMINGWASDEFVYNQLIEDWEKRDESSPYFAHVITTQNHGGYNEVYDKYGITVDGDTSLDTNRQLQSYLNEEKESIEQLNRLINYFENQNEPVVIVFWGDHCPGYYLFGLELDSSVENIVKAHLTPLLIWDNLGWERDDLGIMASYKITPYILHRIGITSDNYMNYSYNTDIPNVLEGYEVDGLDSYISIEDWPDGKKKIWDNLWLLQYDRMFGKNYSSK